MTFVSAQKIDTSLNEAWNGNAWINSSRSINSYDQACRLTTTLFQLWDQGSSTWRNSYLFTITYSGDKIASDLLQVWNLGTNTWDNVSRHTSTYNGSLQVTSVLTETWVALSWQNFRLESYTYDGNGFRVTTLSQNWNAGWQNDFRVKVTFNSDSTASQSIYQSWNTFLSAWENGTRTTYSYNNDKSLNTSLGEAWDKVVLNWVNLYKDTFTYNAGKQVAQLDQQWSTDHWVNNALFSNTFDQSGFLIHWLYQIWNMSTNIWDNLVKIDYTNNSDGTVHQSISQGWDFGSWQLGDRTTYSYNAACSLPLTLLNLMATISGSTALVSWQTVNEINTSEFVVQRSLNALTFTDVATIKAKGTSSKPNSYSYSGNITSLPTGRIYYRLWMKDKDGKTSYSKIVNVSINGHYDFIITPNPARNYFVITSSGTLTNAVVTISDFAGRIVIRQNLGADTEQKINISALAKGDYMVSVITQDGIIAKKLVVQ